MALVHKSAVGFNEPLETNMVTCDQHQNFSTTCGINSDKGEWVIIGIVIYIPPIHLAELNENDTMKHILKGDPEEMYIFTVL